MNAVNPDAQVHAQQPDGATSGPEDEPQTQLYEFFNHRADQIGIAQTKQLKKW